MTPRIGLIPPVALERIHAADGAVVIGGGAESGELAALTLALPLTAARDRTTVLAAPLLSACWARAVARAARRSGAAVRVEPVTTADYAGVTVEALHRDRRALDAVPGWFTGAADPEPAFARVRAECLARDGTDERWSDGVRGALFGPAHRYGVGHDERSAFLRSCGPDDAARLSAGLLTAAPPVLALSQPDAGQLRRLAELVAAEGPGPRTGPSAARSSGTEPSGGRSSVVQEPVTVSLRAGPELAYHLLGTPGVYLGSPDKAALHLAWAVLGGREGLLDRRLRRERALTYSLAAFSREFASGGYGLVVAGCAPDALEEVRAETRAVLGTLARGEFAAELLESARERLVIQYHRAVQSGRGITERLCGYEIAGLDPKESARYPDRLMDVTLRQLRWAAQRYIGTGDH
jgi:hypothetical protein